jgi:hypothetical protein
MLLPSTMGLYFVVDQNSGIPGIHIHAGANASRQSWILPGRHGVTYSHGPGNTDWA